MGSGDTTKKWENILLGPPAGAVLQGVKGAFAKPSVPGPTPQQQALLTQQAMVNANLNLEENAQRKTILNAMNGMRVFRGSALSRAVAGNTPGVAAPPPGPSPSQTRGYLFGFGGRSLLDLGTGATPAGGAGASGGTAAPGGGAGGGARGPAALRA
jgi:hypothetical protein